MVSSLRARVAQLESLSAGITPPLLVRNELHILHGRERKLKEQLAAEEHARKAAEAKLRLAHVPKDAKDIKAQREELRSLARELEERQNAVESAAAATIAAREKERKARVMLKQKRLEEDQSAIKIQSIVRGRKARQSTSSAASETNARPRDEQH